MELDVYRMTIVTSTKGSVRYIRIWKVGSKVAYSIDPIFYARARSAITKPTTGDVIRQLFDTKPQIGFSTAAAAINAMQCKGEGGVYVQDNPDYENYVVVVECGQLLGAGQMTTQIFPMAEGYVAFC